MSFVIGSKLLGYGDMGIIISERSNYVEYLYMLFVESSTYYAVNNAINVSIVKSVTLDLPCSDSLPISKVFVGGSPSLRVFGIGGNSPSYNTRWRYTRMQFSHVFN